METTPSFSTPFSLIFLPYIFLPVSGFSLLPGKGKKTGGRKTSVTGLHF
jgi:hypothetical protein